MSESDTGVEVRRSDCLSIKQLSDRVNLVHQVLEKVLIKGTHYGTVPGCGTKMVLLKPGADVLAMTFRLVPQFKVERTNLDNGHREYDVTCSMHSPDGSLLGQGVGSASSMEKKYRYRKNESGQRIENEDIADVMNTVLKIAKKRAHIDATLTVTGAADIFTQDLIDEDEPKRPPVAMPTETAQAPEQAVPPAGSTGAKISEPQVKRMLAKSHASNVTQEDLRLYLRGFGIEHFGGVPRALYDQVCNWIDNGGCESPEELTRIKTG
ncbi:MAG: hypothetical protein L6437_12025 [Kiritimatiellae bacterium]|nr:hypothetical protein [Kiritimatiellia bacterium]